MKYKGLSYTKRESYQLPYLDGGINVYSEPCAISENQLKESENMWFKEGMLRSRPGISAVEGSAVSLANSYAFRNELKFTDIDLTHSRIRYTLAYTVITDHMTKEELRTYLVEKDGSMTDIQPIMFSRVADDEFFRLYNVFFVSGKKTKHSGIYAFVTRYCMNYGYMYEVYELSLELLRWEKLDETDFYIPVTYMYGRGNNYEKAVEIERAVEEKPVSPQSYNMLSGYFKAYYSSDEFSDQFVLPVRKIKANTGIECRIYYNPYSYASWRIPASADSVESVIYGAKVTMHCDRQNGIISFKGADNTEYQVPRMKDALANNVVITACRDTDMKQRVMLNNQVRIYNSRYFLSANEIYKNDVCSAPVNNPLYFAEDMKTSVGRYGSRVVALAVQQNKLIAFKENEIYKINVTDKSGYSIRTLFDDTYNFLETERLTTTPIHHEIGCVAPHSIALCGNKLVWMGDGGRIYTLVTTTYGKQNNVYEVSLPINKLIPQLSPTAYEGVFGVEYGGYYMLSIDNSVFLMDYKIRNFGISTTFTGLKDTADSISWYRWSFPNTVKLTSFLKFDNKLLIGCKTYPAKAYYIASLKDDTDIIYQEDGKALQSYPVSAFFVTSDIPSENFERLKDIDEVYIEGNNASCVDVEISDGVKSILRRLSPTDDVTLNRINPKIRHIKSIQLKISSKKEFSIGKIIVSYHNTSKVR